MIRYFERKNSSRSPLGYFEGTTVGHEIGRETEVQLHTSFPPIESSRHKGR